MRHREHENRCGSGEKYHRVRCSLLKSKAFKKVTKEKAETQPPKKTGEKKERVAFQGTSKKLLILRKELPCFTEAEKFRDE